MLTQSVEDVDPMFLALTIALLDYWFAQGPCLHRATIVIGGTGWRQGLVCADRDANDR